MSQPKDNSELFGFFQKMLNPAMTPFSTLFYGLTDAKEIEKKISELEAVKTWLNASVATVDMSIKALEFQRSLVSPREGAESPADVSPPNPAQWAWEMMQKAAQGGVKAAEDAMQAAGKVMNAPPKKQAAKRSRKKLG